MSSPQPSTSTATNPLVPAAPPAQESTGPATAGTTSPNPAITQDYSGELVEFYDHLELVPTTDEPEVSPAVVEAARPKKRKREEVDGDYLVYRQVNFDELEEWTEEGVMEWVEVEEAEKVWREPYWTDEEEWRRYSAAALNIDG
ncbi:MAG: hypothetical protein OHK93_008504 [Ramalina farinacea]|uniref:Uncharacterized protein n=1 Tax=Ramalina farinacea TaxID=258253 RepID=A0AA43TRY6_9LECA|nr:hypothetical protein [Ramalina farinacea]